MPRSFLSGYFRLCCRSPGSFPGGLAGIVVACLLWLALGATAAHAASACPSANARPAQLSKRALIRATLCVLNAERARHGLRALSLDPRLSSAARRHARDMAERNYFDHTSLDGSSFVDRIRRAGYLRGARLGIGREHRLGHGRAGQPTGDRPGLDAESRTAPTSSALPTARLGVGVAGGAARGWAMNDRHDATRTARAERPASSARSRTC